MLLVLFALALGMVGLPPVSDEAGSGFVIGRATSHRGPALGEALTKMRNLDLGGEARIAAHQVAVDDGPVRSL